MKILPPINGLVEGLASCEQQLLTSFSMSNCRAFDVEKEKLRLGQRGGLTKWSATAMTNPVIYMTSIITTYIPPEA